jgi:hypothetical protein
MFSPALYKFMVNVPISHIFYIPYSEAVLLTAHARLSQFLATVNDSPMSHPVQTQMKQPWLLTCVEGLVPSAVMFRGGTLGKSLDDEDSDLINGFSIGGPKI